MTAIIIIAIIVVLILIWCVSTLNGFKRQEIRVNESLSDIEVALTKRCDLLTKMLDTAKNYMKNEKETFTGTIKLRKGMTVGELNTAAGEVDALSGKLAAVAEGYPELRSADVFVELQKASATPRSIFRRRADSTTRTLQSTTPRFRSSRRAFSRADASRSASSPPPRARSRT